MLRIFRRVQICMENMNNFLTPTPIPPTPTHFGCLASPPGKIFLQNNCLAPTYVPQNDQCNVLIILRYVRWSAIFLATPPSGPPKVLQQGRVSIFELVAPLSPLLFFFGAQERPGALWGAQKLLNRCQFPSNRFQLQPSSVAARI